LLANAVYLQKSCRLTLRLREQARSHREYIRQGFVAKPVVVSSLLDAHVFLGPTDIFLGLGVGVGQFGGVQV